MTISATLTQRPDAAGRCYHARISDADGLPLLLISSCEPIDQSTIMSAIKAAQGAGKGAVLYRDRGPSSPPDRLEAL